MCSRPEDKFDFLPFLLIADDNSDDYDMDGDTEAKWRATGLSARPISSAAYTYYFH